MTFPWSPCASGAAYVLATDWEDDGSFTGLDDVTANALSEGVSVAYGRDQQRQLSPAAVGRAAWRLCNVGREYSPENVSSPLFGDLDAARPTLFQASYGGTAYSLHHGYIDDFEVHPDRADRSVDFTSLDGMALLQGVKLSTPLYAAQRTGALIGIVLDSIGWTGPRSLDLGATFVPWWWSEGGEAFTEVQDLVRSEGPPAIAYVAPDGTFTFRDRHHRIQDAPSLTPQATFAAARVVCESPSVTGFSYTAPFVYQHGWRDIINSVALVVPERVRDPSPSAVWDDRTTYMIAAGQTLTVDAISSDPFLSAVAPVEGTDFTRLSGGGTLTVTLSRTSGQSAKIMISAAASFAVITNLQLRAIAVPVARSVRVTGTDSTSIASHGERTYPDEVPWVNANDAEAIASTILAHYAERRPIVKMRVTAQDPAHLLQILTRTVSDRITIRNDELGLLNDFFVESVSHLVRRISPDKGPVHAAVLGCERTLETPGDNPFTFDKAGAGFDQGTFGLEGVDDAATVFIFDHPAQGRFDVGLFGT